MKVAAAVQSEAVPRDTTFEALYTWTPTGGPTTALGVFYVGRERDVLIARQDPKSGCGLLAALDMRHIKRVRLHRDGLARQLHFETAEGVHAVTFLIDGTFRVWVDAVEREYRRWANAGIPHDERSVPRMQRDTPRVADRCLNP